MADKLLSNYEILNTINFEFKKDNFPNTLNVGDESFENIINDIDKIFKIKVVKFDKSHDRRHGKAGSKVGGNTADEKQKNNLTFYIY